MLAGLTRWRDHWTQDPCAAQPCNHYDCQLALAFDEWRKTDASKPE